MTELSRADIRALQTLSPFELKEKLREIAGEHEGRTAFQQLNAGRGNPNFIAPTPREAFFRLGFFALEECRATVTWDPELVGVPQKDGIAARFRDWLDTHTGESGVDLLRRVLDLGVDEYGYDPDAFVWEFADAVIGDHYPAPDRMLRHAEDVVRRYLHQEMGAGIGPVDLFAVEGGTAAICYILDTLVTNRLLQRGDRVAVMTPIFTPYLEIAHLSEYGFDVVRIHAEPDTWQYPDAEIDRLRDRSVKALLCVNPTNPPSVSVATSALERIAGIVAEDNPDLVVVTDDVYATFIDGFTSLAALIPRNTVLVYSFSKYFGATGWRLGVVGVSPDTVLDELIARLPEQDGQALDARYATLSLTPRDIKFVDRLVADSRDVALNHTAGLSQPQQLQMLLFAAYCLLDDTDHYKQQAQALIRRRLGDLLDGMRITLPEDPQRVGYYVELDLLGYARRHYGPEFVAFLQANYEPTDILFRLADQTGVIALNGGGFDAPLWSIRLSIANLRDHQYAEIGRAVRTVAEEYLTEWRARTGVDD
ncbi:MAG: bifunctional aspartate transaminase/aspartate 4-decarboxylase [Pseudonocardia sp.]|uniref:bifunctional aspartate transaminase/aspartate 4-decarboxylase n=1 Tax=unclassified Pseudonocardia TaxID=2619320 RepID=UPI00086BF8D2|nr:MULTISPECIES: bifunctional aspartate transaminase/aspartate 4-decarboxylase [unclassified Pseudonocardia]MBN9111580.1 bifunctional aspartate transaminase/aspartate 4-decarboxylase [Pseudonocardia sp.]ODU02895.1 MAG: aspartate 4-decarboxylase [Pseudonocardia sp. SCN 72-51]ODU98204.1 MAG: aspartate 4-decarboxylase [Pseudonocardia sp. SCN 73-27]